jgi:glycerophosphoryl diester phosphodiesterase
MRIVFSFFILIGMTACTHSNPIIIGHRGAMGYETENTVASVQKALELGVDMIEIDVFRVQSGEIVVFHDERVDRLANSGGLIESYNYFDLSQLTLVGGHRIPLLQDILKAINHKVPLNIELKGAGTSDQVHHILSYYTETQGWTSNQFLISSFNWDELRAYRALDPNARIAVLTEGDPTQALDVAKELNAEAINPSLMNSSPAAFQTIHEAGFKIYVWTVNEREHFESLKAMGADGIFTNFPDRMR